MQYALIKDFGLSLDDVQNITFEAAERLMFVYGRILKNAKRDKK